MVRLIHTLLRLLGLSKPAPAANAPAPPPPRLETEPDPGPQSPVFRISPREHGSYGGVTDPALREKIDRAVAAGTWITQRKKVDQLVNQAVRQELAHLGFQPDREFNQLHRASTPGNASGGFISRHARQYRDFTSAREVAGGHFFYHQDSISRRIPLVESIWEDLHPLMGIHSLPWQPTVHLTLRWCHPPIENEPDFHPLYDGFLVIPTPEGIAEYGKRFAQLYMDHIAPVGEGYRDLRVLCDVAMRELVFSAGVQGLLGTSGANVRRLILARLAGDARFEELYDGEMSFEEEYLQAARDKPHLAYIGNYPQVLREVYRRLQSIPPLENPILD